MFEILLFFLVANVKICIITLKKKKWCNTLLNNFTLVFVALHVLSNF